MQIDFAALIPFAIITTFSPGPNNLVASASALRFGYARTFPLLAGICLGFHLVFTLCMGVTASLGAFIMRFEPFISMAGALYILWLAGHMLFATFEIRGTTEKPLGLFDGMLLQLMNPKVIIYGLTIFTTFLGQVERNIATMVLLPAIFALLSLCSTSTWALAGSFMIAVSKRPRVLRVINTLLALSLVVIAIDLSNIIKPR
jgi:cysteine/O-acetylserine efflux protein